jgi:CheY-like chemotaxis protein
MTEQGPDKDNGAPVSPAVISDCLAPEDTCGQPYLLLVEDNAGDLCLIREILKPLPYALDIVTDGATAISRFRQLDRGLIPRPAAIMLDLGLPKRTGIEVLEACPRSIGSSPVLIITSSSREQDRAQVAALGASGYFVKPASFDEYHRLCDVVVQLLARSAGTPITP